MTPHLEAYKENAPRLTPSFILVASACLSSCASHTKGEPGAYSEQAALQYFSGQDPVFHPCATFRDTFEALRNGVVDRTVLPIENCLAGTIHENLDLLMLYKDITIVGELDFHVNHCLVALRGTKMRNIVLIKSHSMAIQRCVNYLHDNDLKPEIARDTAGSAKLIRNQKEKNVAAIASKQAAEIYDLEVLVEGIQDQQENYTRFLILSSQPEARVPETPGKTSLVFSLANKAGILYRALSVLTATNIDLVKIESRHIHTVIEARKESHDNLNDSIERRWGYVFYVDIARYAEEQDVDLALRYLQEITVFYRVLGSDPRHMLKSAIDGINSRI